MAFMPPPRRPWARVHRPPLTRPSLYDLGPDGGAALWTTTQVMARRVKAKHAPAVNLDLSDGAEAEEDIPHVLMRAFRRT